MQPIPYKKSRPVFLLVGLVAVITFMVVLSKCSHQPGGETGLQAQKQKSGGDTLDVAIEISPLSYRMSGDTISGLDYDFLRAISQISHRPVKFHPFAPLRHAVDGLDKGIYDIVVSSLPATDSLKSRYTLSNPVYLDRQILVQLAGSDDFIDSPEGLGGDTVWVAGGSPFVTRINNLSSEIGEPIHVVEMDGNTAEHLIMLVARGKIPRAVVNAALARKMHDEYYPELDVNTPVSFTQFQCWIIDSNKPTLVHDMNHWIDSLKRTPRYNEILLRYGL